MQNNANIRTQVHPKSRLALVGETRLILSPLLNTIPFPAVIVDVVMKVKKGTVTEDTSTKSLKGAKKEKRLAASRSLSRRARKLPLPSRRHLLCTSAPEIDAINLLIFLDNV